jgi:aspartate kinase
VDAFSRAYSRGREKSVAKRGPLDASGGREEPREAGPPSVIKIGGSCLSSQDSLGEVSRQLAAAVQSGSRIVIVVSALKGATDALLCEAKALGITDPAMLDAHLAQGEAQSARLLSDALRNAGIPAVAVSPGSDYWPVVTDSRHGDADPLVEETAAGAASYLQPMLEAGVTPVVCGFVGMTRSGEVTTMGRGGSDATAILLGRVLCAGEVVLVKDVDGIYSADPKTHPDAKRLPSLSAREALRLSEGGAKVVQAKALRLKHSEIPLRVVGNGSGRGTLIVGGAEGPDGVRA